MRMNTKYIAIIFSILLFGGIFIANAIGLWVTESEKQPELIKEGEFIGMSNPEDIRGSYSFGDISNSFDVTPEIIAEAFGIETDSPEDFQCKMLEEYYPDIPEDTELGTGAVKQFVAIYTGLPYEGEDGFPSTAITVLERENKWTLDLENTLDIIDMSELKIEQDGIVIATDEKESEENHEDEIGVKGNTTVKDVLGWGVSLEQIEEVLSNSIENENMTIRDICNQEGLSFSEVKEKLNTILDK